MLLPVKRKKGANFIAYGLFIVLLSWLVLTLFAQYGGKQKSQFVGSSHAQRKALIVYNADPIYNLDEQVCKSFAGGLEGYGVFSRISTVELAQDRQEHYDLYVIVANTYNWAPDWRTVSFVRERPDLEGQTVVAITLGAGSTARSKRTLERVLANRHVNLLGSRTYWLLKPNDETRKGDKNTAVANDMARLFGEAIGRELQNEGIHDGTKIRNGRFGIQCRGTSPESGLPGKNPG